MIYIFYIFPSSYFRQKLIYLFYFSSIIIISINNSKNQDISLISLRYLFFQLQYVLCDFQRIKVFFKSFVPQRNNTISAAKSTIQPLTWWIIPSVVAPWIDFTVVTYFVLFFILYGSMFLIMESPTINNLFVICWDCCDVFLAFFFSDLLILLMELFTSDETKLLSKSLCWQLFNKFFGWQCTLVSRIVGSFLSHV